MGSSVANNETPEAGQQRSWIVQYFMDFKVLGDNPPAFWAVQFVNLLDSLAYFALLGVLTLFLTQNIMMDKVPTGYVVTGFTIFITLSLFVSGFVTDSLGVKKSLFIAQSLALGTRIVIAACGLIPDLPGRGWIVTAALVLMAPGAAMTQTVFQAANKRFSSKKSRSASFNIWYLIMNIGAMVAGFSIDIVRVTLNVNLSWIFIVGAIAAGVSVLTTLFFIHKTDQVLGEGEESDEAKAAALPKRTGFALLKAVFGESAFWRFIVLMVAVLGVRAVFAYMYLLMPQYWVEVIEQTGSAKTEQGLLQAINPILIVVGLILFIPIANRFNVFKMLVTGAFISSCSLLVLAMPWQWFGPTMASGYFNMSVVMLIVLSIGELVWSPKLTEYTAAIAPPGQEGTYLGLSMAPWFVAKFAVGFLSGHMLNRWVPSGSGLKTMCGGVDTFWDTPEAMWSVLFIWAVAGPIVALIFKGWLTAGADLDPAVKSTPEASRKFRMYSAVAGVVVIAAIGSFLYWNVSQPVPTIMGVDGKPLPASVRSQKDADTCACYIADKAALGPQLCTDAKPAGLSEEEGKEFRKGCLTAWYTEPGKSCPQLAADVWLRSSKPDEKSLYKRIINWFTGIEPAPQGILTQMLRVDEFVLAYQVKCEQLAASPKLAGPAVSFCTNRIIVLE